MANQEFNKIIKFIYVTKIYRTNYIQMFYSE